LKGELKVCEDCAVAEARQKNFNQDWKEGCQAPSERVYLDISSNKDKSYGGSRFWVLIVDDYTDYCWSIFLRAKSDLKAKVTTLLTNLNIAGVNLKFISCDDSGENRLCLKNVHLRAMESSLNFLALKLPSKMAKLKESCKPSLGGLELC
jgi:hypothetical protein